jgi:hypothetical protein
VSEQPGTIRLPARAIAVPSTVSDFSRGSPPAIPAELHVTEAAGHGGFMGMAPADQEILGEVRRFAEGHWAK